MNENYTRNITLQCKCETRKCIHFLVSYKQPTSYLHIYSINKIEHTLIQLIQIRLMQNNLQFELTFFLYETPTEVHPHMQEELPSIFKEISFFSLKVFFKYKRLILVIETYQVLHQQCLFKSQRRRYRRKLESLEVSYYFINTFTVVRLLRFR